jgi:hypothetical protein
MPTYRVYFLNEADHITQPPAIVACATDRELADQLALLPHENALDVWDGARHVLTVPGPRRKAGID